jgi:hypothetical protein
MIRPWKLPSFISAALLALQRVSTVPQCSSQRQALQVSNFRKWLTYFFSFARVADHFFSFARVADHFFSSARVADYFFSSARVADYFFSSARVR